MGETQYPFDYKNWTSFLSTPTNQTQQTPITPKQPVSYVDNSVKTPTQVASPAVQQTTPQQTYYGNNNTLGYDSSISINDQRRLQRDNRGFGFNIGKGYNTNLFGNDRIGRKLQGAATLDANGNTVIDTTNLGRRSLRRLRNRMGGASMFENILRQQYGMQPVTTGNLMNKNWDVTGQYAQQQEVKNQDLKTQPNTPISYKFSGLDDKWLNRTQQLYQNNSNNSSWKSMDTNNDGTITADEIKIWQSNNGLASDGKLGLNSANAMQIDNLNNYSWMNVTPNSASNNQRSFNTANQSNTISDTPSYNGYYNKFKNANAASLRRAYQYYSSGNTGNYYDKASNKTYTEDGKQIIKNIKYKKVPKNYTTSLQEVGAQLVKNVDPSKNYYTWTDNGKNFKVSANNTKDGYFDTTQVIQFGKNQQDKIYDGYKRK